MAEWKIRMERNAYKNCLCFIRIDFWNRNRAVLNSLVGENVFEINNCLR